MPAEPGCDGRDDEPAYAASACTDQDEWLGSRLTGPTASIDVLGDWEGEGPVVLTQVGIE
jgi:hypothetical protein